jgi:hypothetical protein
VRIDRETGKFRFERIRPHRIPNRGAIAVKQAVRSHFQKLSRTNAALAALTIAAAVGDMLQAANTGFIGTADSPTLVDLEAAAGFLGEGGQIRVETGGSGGVQIFEVRDGRFVNTDSDHPCPKQAFELS